MRQAAQLRQAVTGRLRAEGLSGFVRQIPRRLSQQRRSLALASNRYGFPRLTTRYSLWQAAHQMNAADLDHQREVACQFSHQPCFSAMTPVYNPPPEILRSTIESVLAQTYSRWELCLADGASDRAGVRAVLDEYEQRDPRIRVLRLERNLGISGNSNEAARLATGDFLMIFDHDDLLAPNALFEIATAIQAQPDADLIYYDEDMVSAD